MLAREQKCKDIQYVEKFKKHITLLMTLKTFEDGQVDNVDY